MLFLLRARSRFCEGFFRTADSPQDWKLTANHIAALNQQIARRNDGGRAASEPKR